jgi:predicted nucleic acid-binding protein
VPGAKREIVYTWLEIRIIIREIEEVGIIPSIAKLSDELSTEKSAAKNASVDVSETKKSALKKLAQFILNRSTENIRNELYEYLIMSALHGTRDALAREEIILSIQKDLGITQLTAIFVDPALGRLIEKKDVECIQSDRKAKYFLSPNKREKFLRITQEYDTTVSTVTNHLIKLVEEKYKALTNAEKATMIQNFQTLLGTIFATNGFIIANSILGEKKGEKAMESLDVPTLLEQILGKDNLSEIQKEVFMNYLYSPDESLSIYLYSLAQSYYLIEVLNLDPECRVLIKENVDKITGYLDTNMIIPLVTNDERSKAAEKLIKLSTDLGFKIKFTKRTREEFIKHTESKKAIYLQKGKVAFKNYDKVTPILENGFLKDYLEKKKTNQGLTYDGYFARLTGIEALLKSKYSIEFDENPYEEIKKHDDIDRVKSLVVKYASLKSDMVAEHDAYHILLIQDLRKKEKGGILGPNSWFITCDSSLYHVDSDLSREEPERVPSSIYAENWVQMISPLLPPEMSNKTAREAFTTLFASRIPALTKVVKEEDLLELQGTWIDDEDLSPEDLAEVIGDHYVKKHLESLREARARGEEEKISEIVIPMIVRAQKKMKQQYGTRIERLRNENDEKLDKLKQEYDTKLSQVIKRSKFILPLFLVGLACLILPIILGLVTAYQRLAIPDVVYWGLTFSAILFIAASFFGRRVFDSFKLK